MENILARIIPIVIGCLGLKFGVTQVGWLWKMAGNSASGFICLWLLNLLAGLTGIVFESNLFTCLLVGILGIPGSILLVIGQLL